MFGLHSEKVKDDFFLLTKLVRIRIFVGLLEPIELETNICEFDANNNEEKKNEIEKDTENNIKIEHETYCLYIRNLKISFQPNR